MQTFAPAQPPKLHPPEVGVTQAKHAQRKCSQQDNARRKALPNVLGEMVALTYSGPVPKVSSSFLRSSPCIALLKVGCP
jgi:hypothetical protein